MVPASDQEPALVRTKWSPRRELHPYPVVRKTRILRLDDEAVKSETRGRPCRLTPQGRTARFWQERAKAVLRFCKKEHTPSPLSSGKTGRIGRPRDLMRALADWLGSARSRLRNLEKRVGLGFRKRLFGKQKTHFRVEVGDDGTTSRSVSLIHFLIWGTIGPIEALFGLPDALITACRPEHDAPAALRG